MKRSLLHQCGEALYGPQWQAPLARDLGMSTRTMQRLAVDSSNMTPARWKELAERIATRMTLLSTLSLAAALESKPPAE